MLIVEELKAARERANELREARQKLLAEFQSTPAYVAALAASRKADEEESKAEELVRSAAVASYLVDGNKHPHPKVEIRLYKIVNEYDEVAAKEWCAQNMRIALKLNTSRFEEAVKCGDVPDSIATVSEEPRARIATDL